MKLTFLQDGIESDSIEGKDASDIVRAWNDDPWQEYLGPDEFVVKQAAEFGATGITADSTDLEFLEAICAARPDEVRLDGYSAVSRVVQAQSRRLNP